MEVDLDERLLSPAVATRAVLGEEGRKLVEDPKKAPWSLICCLEYREPGRWPFLSKWVPFATGWLVAPDKVVTAAHCLEYPSGHEKVGTPLAEIRVSPGRHGHKFPFGHQTGYRLFSGWERGPGSLRTPARDFGVIGLPKPFPHVTTPFEFGCSGDPACLVGQKVCVSGYPVVEDLEPGFQYFHEDEIVEIRDGLLHYRTDTTEGQSGGPVFLIHPTSAGRARLQVVAIHAHTSEDKRTNLGPLLSGETGEQVARWVKQGPEESALA